MCVHSFQTEQFCNMTDPFRNMGYPCGNSFCGMTAMRAPEVVALTQYLIPLKDQIYAYFNFHTYGQKWLYPSSYSSQPVPNAPHLVCLLVLNTLCFD